jgi:two-component system, sensor histidine kinase and response regulator
MQSAGEGIYGLDVNGNTTFVNQAGITMVGWNIDELIGKPQHDILHHSYPDGSPYDQKDCPIYAAFKDGKPHHIDSEVFWRKDGSSFPVEYTSTPIIDNGKIKGAVVVFKDITDRKLLEEALKEAKNLAESASQSKSEFLANMSHEIRTPMNAVIGLTELALQVKTSPQLNDYLTKISNSSQSLLRIINDILDFSKIEAGKLELENSDFLLREVFEHLSDMFRSQVAKKHIELIMCFSEECRYELNGDSLRLEQVLMNLISNAVKFTEEGEIEIQVKTNLDSYDRVKLEFSIRDTGLGMTDEQVANLFQAFNQADSSTTRKFGGTGLGLSISKRLVAMMDGQIWVDSEPGRGTVFYFTASFKRNSGFEMVDMATPDDMDHLRVLVVDDNQAARNALQKTVEMFNFSATGVASGSAALAAVKQGIDDGTPYQLVLIDWLMPELNGINTIRQIKEQTTNGVTPKLLLLTPFDREQELRHQGASVGADGTISKPANCSILFDTIMDIFGKSIAKAFRAPQNTIVTSQIIKQIGGAQVLLVEDNAVNRQIATEILEGIGIVVDIAEDGLEAIDKIKKSTYDAVLMDIQMPEMDGLQATRQIRLDQRFRDLPIIAMTAHAMIGDHEKSLSAGMNDHVVKPIERQKLYSALIKRVLKQSLNTE